MTDLWLTPLTGVAAAFTWLAAGVLLAFSDFVMRALGAIPSSQGVAAMRSINVTVNRTIFLSSAFFVFVASWAFLIEAGLQGGAGSDLRATGAALYILTVIGVTIIFNVPMNKALSAAGPDEVGAIWRDYLIRWTRWNHVRTAGATASAILLTFAAFA